MGFRVSSPFNRLNLQLAAVTGLECLLQASARAALQPGGWLLRLSVWLQRCLLESTGGGSLGQGLRSPCSQTRHYAAATAAAEEEQRPAGRCLRLWLLVRILSSPELASRAQRSQQGKAEQLSHQNLGRLFCRESRDTQVPVPAGDHCAASGVLLEEDRTGEFHWMLLLSSVYVMKVSCKYLFVFAEVP